jgi:hypothetical protein
LKPKDPLAKAHVQAPPFDLVTSERNKEKERKEFERERERVCVTQSDKFSIFGSWVFRERERETETESGRERSLRPTCGFLLYCKNGCKNPTKT